MARKGKSVRDLDDQYMRISQNLTNLLNQGKISWNEYNSRKNAARDAYVRYSTNIGKTKSYRNLRSEGDRLEDESYYGTTEEMKNKRNKAFETHKKAYNKEYSYRIYMGQSVG